MTDLPHGPTVPSPPAWPPPRVRPRVPGTVQAAAIVTWVCCALVALMTLFFLLAAAFVGSVVVGGFESAGLAEAAIAILALAFGVVGGCALACWFAWQAWRRRPWARIALAVSSGVALAGALATLGPHSVVVAPGAIAVLVLLFLPDSNDWFRAG